MRFGGVQRRAEAGATRAEDRDIGVADVDREPRGASVVRSHPERQQNTTAPPTWMRIDLDTNHKIATMPVGATADPDPTGQVIAA